MAVFSKQVYLLTMKRYYVYILLDDRTAGSYDNQYATLYYKPFYVGMGDRLAKNKTLRHLQHYKFVENNNFREKKYNPHKFRIIGELLKMNHKPNFSIVYESDIRKEVEEIEIQLIAFYGKEKQGGLLTNIADGGVGGNIISKIEGLREKMQKINSDRWRGVKNPNYKKPLEESFSYLAKNKGNHWNKGRRRVLNDDIKTQRQDRRIQYVKTIVRIDPTTLKELEILRATEAIIKYKLQKSQLYKALKEGGKCKGFYWKNENSELVFSISKRNNYVKAVRSKKPSKIICYKKNWDDLEELVFESIEEASIGTGFCTEIIRKKCREGSQKEKFFRYENNQYKIKSVKTIKKKVERIDSEGNSKTYNSLTEAAQDTSNARVESVFAVCSGRIKTYKKYKFKYL